MRMRFSHPYGMEIRYPLQDDNRDELEAAQSLMQGFTPGDLNAAH